MKKVLKIHGMNCLHCAKAVENILCELGASNVEISLKNKEVRYEGQICIITCREMLESLGYELRR